MTMTFRQGTEEYYQKFIELQEKLRKSEEERLVLEMKFNEMMQVTREEEQSYYKRLRSQYKQFLEENRKRQERNERILRLLERVESRASMLEAKTQRIQFLRLQYHNYLDRISAKNKNKSNLRAVQDQNESKTGTGKVVDGYNDRRGYLDEAKFGDNNTRSGDYGYNQKGGVDDGSMRRIVGNDSNIRYNQNGDESAFGYNQGRGGGVEEIAAGLNRNFGYDQSTTGIRNVGNYNSQDGVHKPPSEYNVGFPTTIFGRPTQVQDNDNTYLTKFDDDIPHTRDYLKKFDKFPDAHSLGNSYEDDTYHPQKASTIADEIMNSINKRRRASVFPTTSKMQEDSYDNKSNSDTDTTADAYTYKPSCGKHGGDPVPKKNVSFGGDQVESEVKSVQEIQTGVGKEENVDRNGSAVINIIGDKEEIISQTYTDDNVPNQRRESVEDIQPALTKDSSINQRQETVEKIPQIQNSVSNQGQERLDINEANVIKQADINGSTDQVQNARSDEGIAKKSESQPKLAEIPTVTSNQNTPPLINHEQSKIGLSLQDIPKSNQLVEKSDNQVRKVIKPVETYQGIESKLNQNPPGIPEKSLEENVDEHLIETKTPHEIEVNKSPTERIVDDINTNVLRDDYKSPHHESSESKESVQILKEEPIQNPKEQITLDNENLAQINQPVQDPEITYDESQLDYKNVQYDVNGQPIQYDENGQILQYDQTGYDENGQPIQYEDNVHYDENGQLLQYDANGQPIQYDENGQLLQYDENGQPIAYDPNIQYDQNNQPIQYDENGQRIQYDENIQYDPNNYDLTNQPIQYDANNQPIHYDQNYDPNNPPVQYDENNQPIQYDTNNQPYAFDQPQEMQYDNSNQQYDENGQLMQYDENGELISYYPENYSETPQETTEPSSQITFNENGDEKKQNVLDLLETDTESGKQDTNKVSNDSDFDFSNATSKE